MWLSVGTVLHSLPIKLPLGSPHTLGCPRKWYLNWKETTRVWALCRQTSLSSQANACHKLSYISTSVIEEKDFFLKNFGFCENAKHQGKVNQSYSQWEELRFSHPSLKMSYDVKIQWGWLWAWEVERCNGKDRNWRKGWRTWRLTAQDKLPHLPKACSKNQSVIFCNLL